MLIIQHHFAVLDLETADRHKQLTNFRKFPERLEYISGNFRPEISWNFRTQNPNCTSNCWTTEQEYYKTIHCVYNCSSLHE